MKNEHILRPERVELCGQEQEGLAEKTWPLAIPEGMRLAAIVTGDLFGGQTIEVAFDITEPQRYQQLLELVWAGKWSNIRLFFLSDIYLEQCRKRPPP